MLKPRTTSRHASIQPSENWLIQVNIVLARGPQFEKGWQENTRGRKPMQSRFRATRPHGNRLEDGNRSRSPNCLTRSRRGGCCRATIPTSPAASGSTIRGRSRLRSRTRHVRPRAHSIDTPSIDAFVTLPIRSVVTPGGSRRSARTSISLLSVRPTCGSSRVRQSP